MGLSLAERHLFPRQPSPFANPAQKPSQVRYLKRKQRLTRDSTLEQPRISNENKVQGWKRFAIGNTINLMLQAGLFAMHVLEVMFFVGMAGSAVVVIISFIEDAQELFGED